MNTQFNQAHSIQTNIPIQPQVMQVQMPSFPQPNIQITNPQMNPIQSQQLFNLSSNMNLGIQENFNDPMSAMFNPMMMPNFGMGMMPGQIFQNMISTMNQMGAVGPSMGGTSFHGMMNMQGLGNGTMISKQYVSKIDYSDGTPKQESYQSQSIKQFGEDGHNISERQEAYKNSATGLQQAALQRLLDDKGTKTIRQRNINTGTQEQHDLYQGITENDLNNFNKQYTDYREKIHFQDNYKYLNSFGKGNASKYLLGKGGMQTNNQIMGQLPEGTITMTNPCIPQNLPHQINSVNLGNTVAATQPLSQISYQVGGNPSSQLPFTSQVTIQTNPTIVQSNVISTNGSIPPYNNNQNI